MRRRDVTVEINGTVLKADRKSQFRSAEKFAEKCNAAVATIYRAEQGKSVRYSYLQSMAKTLGNPAERYLFNNRPPALTPDIAGAWSGYLIAADQRIEPYIVEESITLAVDDVFISGSGAAPTPQGHRVKLYERCSVAQNVFFGTVKIEGWEEPSGTGSFTLSISRNRRWMEGFASWYDPDSDKIEVSRYILVRHQGYDFEKYQIRAREIMEGEMAFYRFRKSYENEYSLAGLGEIKT